MEPKYSRKAFLTAQAHLGPIKTFGRMIDHSAECPSFGRMIMSGQHGLDRDEGRLAGEYQRSVLSCLLTLVLYKEGKRKQKKRGEVGY